MTEIFITFKNISTITNINFKKLTKTLTVNLSLKITKRKFEIQFLVYS